MITIDDDFADAEINYIKGQDTKKNRDYIKNNWETIVTCEEEMLEQYVNESGDALNTARIVRDNRGEHEIVNDEGQPIAYWNYWADVTI